MTKNQMLGSFTKMSGQQYLNELYRKQEENKKVDSQVEELIKQLKNVQESYYERLYAILKSIIVLRQKQIKNYGQTSLSREIGIDLTSHQIAYIFGYEAISSYTKSQITNGKLKLSSALFIIRQDKRYRNAFFQDKVVKMYLEGKLLTTEISRLSNDIIFGKVKSNTEITKANKQLVRMTYSIQEYMKVVKSKKNLFSDKKSIGYLINQLDRFRSLLQDTLKTGEKLK